MPKFKFDEGSDTYTRFIKVHDLEDIRPERVQGVLQNGVGHCCAATMLSNLSPYGFWNNATKVQSFIDEMTQLWKQQKLLYAKNEAGQWIKPLSVFIISGFYVMISPENGGSCDALITHPQTKKVHSFKNQRGGVNPDANTIDLYFMEFVA